jgi:hypothetical protein
MQCLGITKTGTPCRKQASSNGYCHLHGGIPSRRALRNDFHRTYANMTPEERDEHNNGVWVIMLIIVIVGFLYGFITGDWSGVGKWFSR